MCGISGIINWGKQPVEKTWTDALIRAQHHRGPDGGDCWNKEGAALVHNRLAIIDPNAGHQPMVSADGRYVVVYNGELYNFQDLRGELEALGHSFRTHSDTEVVLSAYIQWKQDCVVRFRGMFGFAIWDSLERSLFVARDRIGIKPFCFYQTPEAFVFASELQAIKHVPFVPLDIDLHSLDLYLHYQYVPYPRTIYRHIHKLQPGHCMLLRASDPLAKPQCYWDVRFDRTPANESKRSVEDWLEEMDHVISESVRRHLVSDVPFGAFLSGGVDSSLVCALMKRHLNGPLRTYTIGFKSAEVNESPYAEAAAKHLGSQHTTQFIDTSEFDLFNELLPKLARHYGEPFADSSMIPTYFVSRLAAADVKMVLSGDGGDELFAGYNTYTRILGELDGMQARNKSIPLFERLKKFGGRIGSGASRSYDIASAAKSAAIRDSHSRAYAYFNDDARAGLLKREVAGAIGRPEQEIYDRYLDDEHSTCNLSALQYLDLKTYLPGDVLTKVDIASMAHSLEVRVPLLDHKVVELAARIPAGLRLPLGHGGSPLQKDLLKRVAAPLYPSEFFERPKQGFGVPLGAWLKRDARYVRERLISGNAGFDEWFERSAVEALCVSEDSIAANSAKAWALLCLSEWVAADRKIR